MYLVKQTHSLSHSSSACFTHTHTYVSTPTYIQYRHLHTHTHTHTLGSDIHTEPAAMSLESYFLCCSPTCWIHRSPPREKSVLSTVPSEKHSTQSTSPLVNVTHFVPFFSMLVGVGGGGGVGGRGGCTGGGQSDVLLTFPQQNRNTATTGQSGFSFVCFLRLWLTFTNLCRLFECRSKKKN